MGSYNTAVITTVGQALLTSVIGAQGTMTFTKLQTSSYAYASGTDLSALTSLNNVEQEANMGSASIIDSTHIAADATISNSGISTEYNANTLGIFASDGVNEVLFAVSTAVTPDVIPVDQGGTPSTYKYKFTLAVSSTSDITISAMGDISASDVAYDNTNSWLTSTNVQNAIDEIVSNLKHKAVVTPSATTATVSNDTPTATVTFTTNSDGTPFVSSSDTSVATASVNGTTVTITGVSRGTAVITINTAETETYSAGSATITVTSNYATIYGASWDGTSTTSWTRTDAAASFIDPVPYVSGSTNYSSPFDTIAPWSMMIKDTQDGEELVMIPKFWYKLTQNGAGIKVQIADGEISGFSVSPAHMDRGDGKGERNRVYIGRYHCSTGYHSLTGVKPIENMVRSAARTGIHALGSDYWQMDFAMLFTLWLLYIVEFADWNSQAKIGYGGGDNSATGNMGYTDTMPYHTGTIRSSRTTYALGTQYRYIEGLWDNVFDFYDGCYCDANGLNIIKNPADFSDTTGGTSVGTPSSGYPSALSVKNVSDTYPLFIPTAASGSGSTYTCDIWGFGATYACLYFGGAYNRQTQDSGLFFSYFAMTTDARNFIGCRLMKLP